MSVRELSPVFQWGFAIRASKWLVPLVNNNIFSFGKEAMSSALPITGDVIAPNEVVLFKRKPDDAECPACAASLAAASIPCSSPLPSSPALTASVAPAPLPSSPAIARSASAAQPIDEEMLLRKLRSGELRPHQLEAVAGSDVAGVRLRRRMLVESLAAVRTVDLSGLPFEAFDYALVNGRCIENCIGFAQLPVGVAGPLLLDGAEVHLPMATTEGCLVASTQRGCKAISSSGGCRSVLLDSGMTRGPVVRFPSAVEAGRLKAFLEEAGALELLRKEFNATSRFARLQGVKATVAGRLMFLRFKSSTGDAMGMNMLTKGVEACLEFLLARFPAMSVVALSGNYCTDKKPAAINWIDGRGRSVTCEAVVKREIVRDVLKTDVPTLVALNQAKNHIGSAMAGSIGGFNAHAANIVTALFIATGQDPAQNVESSNCITSMEETERGDLYIAVTMPSLEVGTVGGGTHLPAQAACLELIGVRGPHPLEPGRNAAQLARVVAAGVLAGELSLNAALAAGHLTRAHMRLNRSKQDLVSLDCTNQP